MVVEMVNEDSVTRFKKHLSLHDEIEGWFSVESAAVWDALLGNQRQRSIAGHMLEIGVWKGKSAVLMARHLSRNTELGVLVDLELDEPSIRENLRKVADNTEQQFQLRKLDSRKLAIDPLIAEGFESFRWIHIDGEHSARAIMNDLAVANSLLADHGIVCVDDFYNWLYPQVTEATLRYVRERPEEFTIFLCGYNKAYLTRPHTVQPCLRYCRDELMTDLESRGVEATLAKTTYPAEMNTFGIGPRFESFRMRGPDWDQDSIAI